MTSEFKWNCREPIPGIKSLQGETKFQVLKLQTGGHTFKELITTSCHRDDLEISILIGYNCPRAVKPKEVILGKGEDLYAVRTLLGWGIIGPVGPSEGIPNRLNEEVASSCNRILARKVHTGRDCNLRFVLSSNTKEVNPFTERRMFEEDFSEEPDDGPGLSKQDRRFLTIAREGITHLENGHYELPLPLKDLNVKLLNNCDMAVRRLSQLKK